MGLNLTYSDGQTPIDEEEKEGLLISSISTLEALDEFEQKNIEDAIQWMLSRSFKAEVILTEKFICNLHKRMFGNVWAWAGKFRKTDKNLGIDKWQISLALKILCDDALYWIKNETYPADQIGIRFKHRLVSIHCFPNGNGRHSRLMADIMISNIFKVPLFSWGAGNSFQQDDLRLRYLIAIKAADKGDFQPLLTFVRS